MSQVATSPPLEVLRALEVELHHPGVRCSRERLLDLLHPDFHEVGRSGNRYTREGVVAHLAAQATSPDVIPTDFAARWLAPGCAQLTYRSAQRQADGTLTNHTERSSIWLHAEGRWQLVHHQGTPSPPPADSAEAVVREFWRLMATNDFHAVTRVLAPGFVLEWPQSNERIRGGENFARMNAEYPTAATWTFHINRLVSAGPQVVTQVSVSDGTQSGEPVSFFTVDGGRITRLVEYWPEPFEPAANRRHLVERMP